MKSRRLLQPWLLLLLCLLLPGAGRVESAPAHKSAAPTRPAATKAVLALFKSSENDTAQGNLVRKYAARALERAGYRVDYRDAEAALPGTSEMAAYKGVITWYRGAKMKDPIAYLAWLAAQIRAGRKVVILGNFGAATSDEKTWLDHRIINEFFVPFGLKYHANWTNKTGLLRVKEKDAAMVECPAPIDLKAIGHYVGFDAVHAEDKSYLVVERTDVTPGSSSVVVRTPHGGFALEGYLYTGNPDQPSAWHLNLASFLRESLEYKPVNAGLPTKRVLGLYKSSEKATETDNELRLYVREPLQALGYDIDIRDVDAGWPSLAEMGSYDAIVTWYRGATMERAAEYAEWLADNMAQGRRVIVLGNYGAYQERIRANNEVYERWLGLEEYNNFFAPFGLEFQRQWTGDPKVIRVASKDPKMVEYQIPLTAADVKHYYKWANLGNNNEPYLVLRRTDLPDSDSPVVARTVGGGMALESYILQSKPPDWVIKWRLNLPEFLKRCLTYKPAEGPQPVLGEIPVEELKQIPAGVAPIVFPRYGASALPADGTEFKNVVLSLFKSSEKDVEDHNLVHLRCEVILNHLGIKVVHYDIEKGLPSDDFMAPYMGVITWFHNSYMDDPVAYAQWVKHQVEQGRRFVVMGDPGLRYHRTKKVTTPGEAMFYEALGFKYNEPGASTENILFDETTQLGQGPRTLGGKTLTVKSQDPKMFNFEGPLQLNTIVEAPRARSVNPKNRVLLSVHVPRWGHADPVAITPFGAIAEQGFAFAEPPPPTGGFKPDQEEEEGSLGNWKLNPFRFFTEAFALQDTPRMDVTTLNGSRVFYSHIDGDGLPGISLIDRSSLAASFIYNEVLKVYPLPVSASVITNDLLLRNRRYYNREIAVYRRILALDNIEPATHTTTHPFNWRDGDLNVTSTEPRIQMETRPTDLARQITYSANFINRYLCPPGKRVEILLWTGNCYPNEEAIATVDANGLRNLNGGDPILDHDHPSTSYLCSLTSQVGNRTQNYTSARGEFLYTDGWTKNFDGMKQLVEHYERTESPRRLMPINVYYHFYVGDRVLGIQGLKVPLDYAMKSHVAPLFASQYVDSVSDWRTARLFRRGDAWVVVNSGACRTVRFDTPGKHVDMAGSQGVLGYTHLNGSLYVHLDESNSHEIRLSDKPSRSVRLVQGSHYIRDWRPQAGGVSFNIRGLGPAYFAISGLRPGQSTPVEIRRADSPQAETILQRVVTADQEGKVSFETVLKGYNREYSVRVGSGTASTPPRTVGERR